MNRPATTLIELLLVLALLAILLALTTPAARRALDALAVRSARESAFGMAMRARSLAIARAGADFVVDIPAHAVLAVGEQGVTVAQAQLAPYGVSISADGLAAGRIVLHYDGHGIGRMTSRTIRFRRGATEAGLTFSSFGRVRRW